MPPAKETGYNARMKFTCPAALGLVLLGWVAGCSENETTVSVSVRYWVDHLDPSTFEVTIEQEGQIAIVSDFAPRQLNGGDYDVVCEDDWRPNYCRFFQRFEVPTWSAGETTITLTGNTLAGDVPFEEEETIELVENEINVVYFELEGLTASGEPVPEPPPSDAGADAGQRDLGHMEAGVPSVQDGGIRLPEVDAASSVGDAADGGDVADGGGGTMMGNDIDSGDAALGDGGDAATPRAPRGGDAALDGG